MMKKSLSNLILSNIRKTASKLTSRKRCRILVFYLRIKLICKSTWTSNKRSVKRNSTQYQRKWGQKRTISSTGVHIHHVNTMLKACVTSVICHLDEFLCQQRVLIQRGWITPWKCVWSAITETSTFWKEIGKFKNERPNSLTHILLVHQLRIQKFLKWRVRENQM